MNPPSQLQPVGALLVEDGIARFRAFGAFGKPAWQSAVQLRAMLLKMNRKRCADYFARPNYDPEQRVLRWTAEIPGNPVPWDAMTPEQQAGHALDLEVVRSELGAFVAELRAKSGAQPGGAAAFASLLEQAMQFPGGTRFLWFIGDQPIIAFWGFEDQDQHVDVPSEAPRYERAAASIDGGGPGAAAAGAVAAPVPLEPARKRAWWWWPLWALLALLLMALLLLLQRGCTPEGRFDPGRVLGGAPPDPAAATASAPADALTTNAGGVNGSGTTISPDGRTSGSGSVDPALTPADAASAALGDTAGLSKPDDKTDPKDPKDPNKDDAKDAAKDLPKDPEAAKKPDADDKKPPDDPKKGKPDPADKTQKPPPDPTKDAPDLALPTDPKAAQKMNFLQGRWMAGDLVDKSSGQKVDVSYEFGKDGKGEATYHRADGSTCKSAVQGSVNGGKLSIDGQSMVPCSGGAPLQASRVECSKAKGGQTECSGINADKTTFSTRVQQQP